MYAIHVLNISFSMNLIITPSAKKNLSRNFDLMTPHELHCNNFPTNYAHMASKFFQLIH